MNLRLVQRPLSGLPYEKGDFRFDVFQDAYYAERLHEALGQDTPASRCCPSVRAYPDRLAPLEYPGHFLVKKITTGGTFRFRARLRYLANAMVDQHIGLEETDDGIWAIHFNTILLATFDERNYIITG
jgi:putative transposase